MMKRILLLIILCLWANSAIAYTNEFVSAASSSGKVEGYSDITFYHNADSWATTPAKGSGSILYSGFSSQITETSTKLAGTGSFDTNDDGYGMMTIPISGNIDLTNFRAGFWIHANENSAATHRIVGATNSTGVDETSGAMLVYVLSGGGVRLIVNGATVNSTTTISSGNDYFIEFAVRNTTEVKLFINGTQEGATGTATTTSHNGTHLTLFSKDVMFDSFWDQIIFSNDPTRNIYAIRTITNFN